VVFRDATRRPAFESALGPLTVRLESFRTRGGGDSPYSFAGTTDAGETFRWTGTVRSQPLRSTGALAFERIRLPRYAPYFEDQVPIALQDGLLDLETRYDLEWGASRRMLQVSGGKLTVDRLAMGPRGAADAAVRLPRVEVTGISVDALETRPRSPRWRSAAGRCGCCARPLIATLIAPDVDTNGDAVPDALSVGFGYQLVGAVF